MVSFKTVLIRQIKKKTFTREYVEQTIANWLIHGWLTDEEAEEIFKVLDEYYPQETSTETDETTTEDVTK